MGCVGSKLDEEDDVVALCRERKRLLKLAVQRRYAFADAHCKYNQSLSAIAAAIGLFVARNSSPSSPFLITFPSQTTTSPMFLQQRPSEQPLGVSCKSSGSTILEQRTQEAKEQEEDDSDESEEEDEVVCEHFHDGVEVAPSPPTPPPPPLQRNLLWDFFDTEVVNGFGQDLGVVREEEDGDGEIVAQNANNGNVGGHKENGVEAEKITGEEANVRQGERGSLKITDTPTSGRDLLEALKIVEEHFVRAYESGLDVSRMLESHRVKMQSGLEEIKESSNKLLRSITRSRSSLSRSSSSKSLLSRSTSRSSSTWTDLKNDLYDDYGGMESGCHSLTLERLYAWEKKLYAEVKAGEETRKFYERKCLQMRNRDGLCYVDRTRVDAKDLYTRILVAVQCAESISNKIQKLRDEELQPQIVELLHGLMKTWKIMLDSHKTQSRILVEVNSFNCPAHGNLCNNSHRLATLQLEAEVQHWRACFAAYVSTQRAYIEALYGWLSKFITPDTEFYAREQRINAPPMVLVCQDWLSSSTKLPSEGVTYAMRNFGKDIRDLWHQQGEEHNQKRKVDELEKEVNKRVRAFQRAERRILESSIPQLESELDARHRAEYLTQKKDLLDEYRKRLDVEKRKEQGSVQVTKHIAVNGFQAGFSSVFESLVEFSATSVRMYSDLITCFENAKAANEKLSISNT